jgi:hypothetical protein
VSLVEATEFERTEADVPDPVVNLLEAHVLARAHGTDVDPSALPSNPPVGTDVADFEAIGVLEGRQAVRHWPWGGAVELVGRVHVQSFMLAGGSPGREAAYIIQRIAGQANANRPQQEHIQVSPHVLRHTFLRKLAEEKGVHHAREASGHQSDCYVWRYIYPDRQALADAIDEL